MCSKLTDTRPGAWTPGRLSNRSDSRGYALASGSEVQNLDEPTEVGSQDEVGLGEAQMSVGVMADLHGPHDGLQRIRDPSRPR